ERMRRKSARHAILEVRNLYNQMAIDRTESIAGEDAYVVKLTPPNGPAVELAVSARTSLILEEKTGGESVDFGDFRNIDGEVVPFRLTIQDALGESTVQVQDVQFGTTIAPAAFRPTKP